MKSTLYDSKGQKKSEISLPSLFNKVIREDISQKVFEARKFALMQPYTSYAEAGKRHSASGKISHRRHKWQGHYGKGISRIPRKKMWRRGTQFYWIGAEVSNTRGGRNAHPPQHPHAFRKVNQKELKIALSSGFASTTSKDYILSHYKSLSEISVTAPVIESLPKKMAEMISTLRLIYGSAFSAVLQKKEVRAGKGKLRNRRYKTSAGLLVVIGNDEEASLKGVDVKKVRDVEVSDLFPLGRLSLYTQKSLEDLKNVA